MSVAYFNLKKSIAPRDPDYNRMPKRLYTNDFMQSDYNNWGYSNKRQSVFPFLANPSNLISGQSKFTKLKSGPIRFKSYTKTGPWSPPNRHHATTHYQVTKAANQQAFDVHEVISLSNIDKGMFNPRYMLEQTKNVGTGSLGGVTAKWVVSVSGADTYKSIFAATQPDVGAIGSVDEVPDADKIIGNVIQELWTIPTMIARIKASTTLKIRNNGTYPCTIRIVLFATKSDHFHNQTTIGDNMITLVGEDWKSSHTINSWGGADVQAEEVENVYADQAYSPEFRFGALPKNGTLDEAYKFHNTWSINLAPGESSTLNLGSFYVSFNLRSVVQRLRQNGYNPLTSAQPTLSGYRMSGLQKGYVIMGKGSMAHDDLDNIGWSPFTVDVEESTSYKWSYKGSEFITIPSAYNDITGEADEFVEPFAPGVVDPA